MSKQPTPRDVSEFHSELNKLLTEKPSVHSPTNPDSTSYLAIRIAEVVDVNFEEFNVILRIKNGSESVRTPTNLTFPGMGSRHFMGAMPQIGDFCIVGWQMQSTFKSPVILGWVGSGLLFAKDWMITQPFSQEEYDMNDPESQYFRGAYNRIRNKLRSLKEGDILSSSASGSDILLDENVLITNRRANEILLRDSDQAIVMRSVQQFHSMAGTRVYSGLIQRDAFNLPTQMFSDGDNWDTFNLVTEKMEPLKTKDNSSLPLGMLTPHPLFERYTPDLMKYLNGEEEEEPIPNYDNYFDDELDPFSFLLKGRLIDDNYQSLSPIDSLDIQVYGGKYFYRVKHPVEEEKNLTEYRIELAHEADSKLPVTEQTEGLDVDRMPNIDGESLPHVEFVLGSVIGNDAFGLESIYYGKPLKASIFDGELAAPSISDASKDNIQQHAAYLFRIFPQRNPELNQVPFFSSVSKDGRAFLNVSGRGSKDKDFAAEAYFGSGLRIGAGQNAAQVGVKFTTEGSFEVKSKGNSSSNTGISLESDGAGIQIIAKGSITEGGNSDIEGAPATSNTPTSILLQADNDIRIETSGFFNVGAGKGFSFGETNSVQLTPKDKLAMVTDAIEMNTKDYAALYQKMQVSFTGPKDGLPTNGALEDVSYCPIIPNPTATVSQKKTTFGVHKESIGVGSKKTNVVTGSVSTAVETGNISNRATTTMLDVTPASVSATIPNGVLTMTASGSVSITGGPAVTIVSAGSMLIKGTTVTLSATGGSTGGILCSGTINPLTGAPFAASGVTGSLSHKLLGV